MLVVNLIASGMSPAEVLTEYPSLEQDDITQALHYAAWLAEETVLPSEASRHVAAARHGDHPECRGGAAAAGA